MNGFIHLISFSDPKTPIIVQWVVEKFIVIDEVYKSAAIPWKVDHFTTSRHIRNVLTQIFCKLILIEPSYSLDFTSIYH